jgi:hypothetical protein
MSNTKPHKPRSPLFLSDKISIRTYENRTIAHMGIDRYIHALKDTDTFTKKVNKNISKNLITLVEPNTTIFRLPIYNMRFVHHLQTHY